MSEEARVSVDMSDKKPGMTPEQIVNSAISDGRLAGLPAPSADTLEIMQKDRAW